MDVLKKLNELGMIDESDPNYEKQKNRSWDEVARALEKYESPAAKRLLKRLRNRKE